eukprot:scaffold40464_cov63-Phaeocystis_antarctica.AAC.1
MARYSSPLAPPKSICALSTGQAGREGGCEKESTPRPMPASCCVHAPVRRLMCAPSRSSSERRPHMSGSGPGPGPEPEPGPGLGSGSGPGPWLGSRPGPGSALSLEAPVTCEPREQAELEEQRARRGGAGDGRLRGADAAAQVDRAKGDA